ncbi:hypothetical protein IFM89_003732 [Coptis chinensis]|uniref:Uncharacterized protein n=1 Tax=Coptis chinensis TaxID=261450 RepID=A0A835I2L2_9MAGN|nr:hypothetical protein IFM89_003732 [Coptis chinensis]
MPMVGLDAMQRANSTLEDFCRSYFMFHGMDVNKPESVFRHLPVLSFTESYIYQLDSFNEELVNISGKISVGNTSNTEKNEKLADHIVKAFQTGALRPLIFVLERHGLMTDRIRVELSFGEEYWALERKLCHALVSRKKISIEDVMRAIHLKSFDYRVLSLLLYQLKETQVNEMHMDFLSISEFLVEDDVIDNNFNILRMFVGVYGASVAPMMLEYSSDILGKKTTTNPLLPQQLNEVNSSSSSLFLAKYITEAEEKYENLSKTLDPDLFINYMRRCEEATKEGGSGAGHSLGTWSIPPVIANEDFYRSERLTSNSVDSSPD